MHADDNFVRSERRFEAHYFHANGNVLVDVPKGNVTVEVMKGFEYRVETRTVPVNANQRVEITVRLKALDVPSDARSRWASGDVHVRTPTWRIWRINSMRS
jgi:hypothetical protein